MGNAAGPSAWVLPWITHIAKLVLRYLERQEFEPVDEELEENVIDKQIMKAEWSLAAFINESEGRMSDAVFFAAQAKKEARVTALRRQRAKRRQIHASVGARGQADLGSCEPLSETGNSI
jgi:hypothetical protein